MDSNNKKHVILLRAFDEEYLKFNKKIQINHLEKLNIMLKICLLYIIIIIY